MGRPVASRGRQRENFAPLAIVLTTDFRALDSRRFMRRLLILLACWMGVFAFATPHLFAADAAPAPDAQSNPDPEKQRIVTAAAAAAATAASREPNPPDFLEALVDSILSLFNISASGNTPTHYAISAVLFIIALLARRIVTALIFPALRKVAAKTKTTLDDKLFPALEGPVAAFIMIVGIFASLKVLKLTPDADYYIGKGYNVAFALVIFWGMWRALGALLEHANEVARGRSMGIAAFMPWIKKTAMVVFGIIGVLMVIQSLGYGENVKTVLAGLGIGGLAFALAAQDTLANVFGAIVVAIDQPFRIGETVKIGQNVGSVEDIGLRSTRIRLVDKSLMVIPNKTVAAETITNLSRFTRRRFEQVIGVTYSTPPEQLNDVVEEIRGIVTAQPEVDKPGVMVFFRDLSASSLDIWVVYEIPDPDFQKAMRVKQRINIAIMRAIAARKLSFAFPTQTIELAGSVAEKLAERSKPAPPSPTLNS
jgi:MscS family membrane protein